MTQCESSNRVHPGAGSLAAILCCAFLLPCAARAADPGGRWGAVQPAQQQVRPAQGGVAAAPNWGEHSQTSVQPALGQTRAGVGTNVGAGFNTNVGTGPAKQAMPTGVNGQVIGSQSNGNFANQAPGQTSGFGYAASHGANMGPNGATPGSQHASGGGGPANQYGGQGVNLNNGGFGGASTGDRNNPNFQSGQSGSNAKYDGPGANAVYAADSDSGHPENGVDANGTEWRNNQVYDGTDAKGTKWRNGVAVGGTVKTMNNQEGGGVGDDPDIGSGSQGGVLVNGNGNVVNPGHRRGSDAGGGRGQTGATTGGGTNQNSANGGYVNIGNKGGGDALLHKPVEIGPMRSGIVDRGNVDPKRGGGAGASVTAAGH